MSSAAKKVVVNTGVLYGKMILTIGISLYTTRIVLSALGAEDFGIYNLVAGIVGMLSFLNAAMTTSTQRYLSFYQGTKELKVQKAVFTNSLFLHICLAFFIVFFIEIIGLFLFDGILNIPEDRLSTAKTIYHFMALSVFFSVISVPFVASINSHENMLCIAIINIIEVFLKLFVALALFHELIYSDNLAFYGFSMALIGFISFALYMIFCLYRYEECSIRMRSTIRKSLLKELTSFAGWNLFGAVCGMGRSQGLAIILNIFFGTVVNAAYGISNQVAGQMNFFSATMLRALNPQIMKSEGMGDRKRMLNLSMMASKFAFSLFAILAIPIIFEIDTILGIWLESIPDNTIIFCQLSLIGIMINQITIGLQSAIQATGRIKKYQLIVGSILLLNLPIAYILLSAGFEAYSVIVSYLVIESCACICRLILLKMVKGFSIRRYIKEVLLRIVAPTICSVIACLAITHNVEYFKYRFVLTTFVSIVIFLLLFYLVSLASNERNMVKNACRDLLNKIK
ncbi:hypothetical protein [Dysgonomonas sp. ZJ279]|uniref:hypothetical protein n=1 Tax=Dysgonomonas sp. ZJ279 TaxID=2709796 RepID=UPI0013ED854B|nr:hypothetical protein [Dysgonomonas sp. ZJ279]